MVIVIFLILLMGGCHAANITPFKESSLELTSREEEEQQQSSDHLVVWTHQNIFENSLPRYKEKYPNIQVDIVTEKPQNLVEKYRKSLISGVTPDLYVIPDDVLGEFSGITGFENLNEKPYYDKAFFASRPKGLLNNYIDSEDKMYAMPLLFFPYVTYYRADILEENGYPSDPYHLSIFLNNRDNWMKLAEDLQVKQQYIIESEQMMLEMILRTSSFLDENYDYVGKHEAFQTITNAATDVVDKGLSPHLNIWHEQGQTAINNDQLVMFQMASYVKDSLKVWAPDQAGKWGNYDIALSFIRC
ncbi:solute binding protein of ABC transporter system [Gracilibacillus boraciitolerans JCM 21714]|uniref:Solute binding protein of ABC transporter system n=2 Tax=Gracilibacillus boraciitolerans TaxID=307521 RepID=W4VQ29_9BACI|nr:solute binding protein of ABC transporter system [Gracilibacillus boraciitolerans JCM 21714]